MKLCNLELVEMNSKDKKCIYVYAVLAKSFFKKKFIKILFESQLPHYWWSEIQKTMVKNKLFFEDLVKSKSVSLDIGILYFNYFNTDDLKKYGTDLRNWKILKDTAVKKQMELCEEYNAQHGSPDLSDLWK